MEQIVEYGSQLLILVAVLAFTVSVITQVTKEMPLLAKIPTNLQVIITSMVLSVLAVIVYCQWEAITILWYYIAGALVLGFFVAFVAMFGWSELTDLWNRYKKE
jgi:glucan phosphoethanolaminetransferase (alkaline phosphatase superfamily)